MSKILAWGWWKPIGVILGLLAGIGAWNHYDPLGWNEPNLAPVPQPLRPAPIQNRVAGPAPQLSEFVPAGNGLPTVVPVRNDGTREALIQAVEFVPQLNRRTPNREPLWGKGPAIPVNFLAQHYDRQAQRFYLSFQRPLAAPGNGEYSTLEIAVVEPQWLGTTIRGKLIVHYAERRTVEVENVEVDVLKEVPKPAP